MTPSITATVSINPTGIQATSSVHALYSSMAVIDPVIQALIDNPTKDKGQDILNKIKETEPLVEVRTQVLPNGAS